MKEVDLTASGADQALIRRIEEMSLNAWPALRQILYDGWIVRFSHGFTRRANCVNPLYSGQIDAIEKITTCEAWYRDNNLPSLVKICSAPFQGELDQRLQLNGYQQQANTIVQVMTLGQQAWLTDGIIEVHEQLTDVWLEAYTLCCGLQEPYHRLHREILSGICLPTCYVIVRYYDHFPVACGIGVREGEYVGIFDVVTDAAFRGKGYATQVMHAIFNWAQQAHTTYAYLQVLADNQPALSLYQKLGFQELYRYWYRRKP